MRWTRRLAIGCFVGCRCTGNALAALTIAKSAQAAGGTTVRCSAAGHTTWHRCCVRSSRARRIWLSSPGSRHRTARGRRTSGALSSTGDSCSLASSTCETSLVQCFPMCQYPFSPCQYPFFLGLCAPRRWNPPRMISRNMTAALMIYSSLFMRFAWCVKPRNYILLACHFGNALVQTLQLSRTFSVSLGIIGTATLSTGISFFGALSATLVSFALLKSWQRRRGLPIEESERDPSLSGTDATAASIAHSSRR